MKTLRYNTETGQYTIHNGQYKTMDGNNGKINPPFVQLEVIPTSQPEHNPDTQRITMAYDIQVNEGEHDLYGINGTATEEWTIIDKTQEELITEANQAAQQAEQQFDNQAAKRLLFEKVEELSDEHIDNYASFFPAWKVGEVVEVDMRFQYKGVVYKVIQAHTTQIDWPPDTTASLWVRVHNPETIPEWTQPQGAHDAYMTGDKVTHNGSTWESTIDANVWEPGVYGWTQI